MDKLTWLTLKLLKDIIIGMRSVFTCPPSASRVYQELLFYKDNRGAISLYGFPLSLAQAVRDVCRRHPAAAVIALAHLMHNRVVAHESIKAFYNKIERNNLWNE